MNKNTVFIVGLSAIVIVGTLFFVGKILNRQPSSDSAVSILNLTSQSEWKTYRNATYHYSIKYPQTGYVGQAQEEEGGDIEKSRDIVIGDGGKGVVEIAAWSAAATSTDLRSLAMASHQKEDNKNSNFPSKKVGVLEEIVFANQMAFSYVVTGSMDGYGGSSDRYLFLENKGVKFMIYYSLDVVGPQEIANTFGFTNGSTTVSIQN